MLKAGILLVLISIFIFCGMIAAQGEYFIRPKFVTNMRAEPSRGSNVVGQARAGQMLQVVGETDDWLHINNNGQEAWVASWLDYDVFGKDGRLEIRSRVGGMNCDRGPEFASGGWVLDVMDCDFDLQPPAGVLPAHQKAILVEGPDYHVERVSKALSRLQAEAPEWYAYVSSAVDKIIVYEPGSRHDVVSGMAYVYPHLRNIYLSKHAASGLGGSVIGIIVHETCHLYEYKAGLKLAGYESEVMCHTIELYALEAMNASTSNAEGMIKFLLFLGE